MSWFNTSGRKNKKKKKSDWTYSQHKNVPIKDTPPPPGYQFPKNMNVRDVYRLSENYYQEWARQNPDKVHFLATPFVDNIMKVHRPGKLTNRRGSVPVKEIEAWCEEAQAQKVTHAFVLIPDRDLDQYYGWTDSKNNIVDSGKDTLSDAYAEHGIQVHHFPIRDFGTPRMSTMIKALRELKQASESSMAKGEKVVVHCSAGIGRTGMFTSCYLVYDNKLSVQDLKELQDDAKSSQTQGFYFDNKQPKKNLSEMQEKVWYDVVSQLDFITDFAKLKDRVEAEGQPIDSEKVIKEVEQADIRKEEEETKRWQVEQQRKKDEKANSFSSPEGGFSAGWQRYLDKQRGDIDDDIDNDIIDVDDEKDEGWVQDVNGNWYKADELTTIIDPDLPPDDYNPLWDREQIDNLKYRKKKRPYLKTKMDAEEDVWQDQLGENPLTEFPIEEMDDEEWLRRFGKFFGLSKFAEDEVDDDPYGFNSKFRHIMGDEPTNQEFTPYKRPVAITPVGPNLYKGRRPGHGNRQLVDESIVDEYAAEMAAKGITDVFVLLNDEELDKYYGGMLIPIYEKHGLRVHHHPIKDFSIPTIEEAISFAQDLDQTISGGGNALVHCSAGIGRTGMMLSIYSIYKGEPPQSMGQVGSQGDFIKEFAKWIKDQ